MSLVLSGIIGLVVIVFAVLAFAPLLLEESAPAATPPQLRVIEGGKAIDVPDAA